MLVTVSGGGTHGYGECVAQDGPYYSSETNETAWHVLSQFIAPSILGVEFLHPQEVFTALGAIRGHNMAKAAVEMAAWDLYARQAGLPLYRMLGGERTVVESGVSIGIQDSLSQLVDKVSSELSAGYRRIKIKIKPGWDIDAVDTVRTHCGEIPLMVDANAAYQLSDASHLAKLDRYGLMMIEQPLGYDDLLDHARLQKELQTPICLDESIKTVATASAALAGIDMSVTNKAGATTWSLDTTVSGVDLTLTSAQKITAAFGLAGNTMTVTRVPSVAAVASSGGNAAGTHANGYGSYVKNSVADYSTVAISRDLTSGATLAATYSTLDDSLTLKASVTF